MSQTDHARRRQCVPPPSVKGRRSVFPRRIAGEAVFSPLSKPIRKRIQVRRPLHPLQLHTNCPRNSRVGVDCQYKTVCPRGDDYPAIRAWVWIARRSICQPLTPKCPQFARGCGLPACGQAVHAAVGARNSRVGVIPLLLIFCIKKAQPHAKVVLFVLPPH